MATYSQGPAKNLSTLALFIANDVRNAMRASFTIFVADALFYLTPEERKARFRTNPANTLLYTALKALVERSIVTISETLKDEHRLHPHDANVRRLDDMRNHRHAISHPMTVEWKNGPMQAFVDAGRRGSDWRAAQIWDVQRSINETLRRHNLPTHNDSLQVSSEMALSVHAMLEASRQPEAPLPTVAALVV